MDEVIGFLEPHFEQWGYVIVFAMTALENSAFVGAFVPGDVVLLLAGFFASRTGLDLVTVMAVAFAGGLVGDTGAYLLGRLGGRRIVDRWGRWLLPRERMARVDRYFREYGMWAVTIGRIAPVVRTVNTFTAGMARMAYPRFIFADAIAAAVWAVTLPVLGFLFSESLEATRRTVGWIGVPILLIFAAGLYWTYRRMSRRLAAEALRQTADDQEPSREQ
jgi:membrane-associated protein